MARPAERAWLAAFLRDWPGPLGPAEPPPPWSASTGPLREDEAAAELAERARGFLGRRDAPPLLAASLIHAAVLGTLQSDLSDFKKQKTEQGDTGDGGSWLEAAPLQCRFFNKLLDICGEWQKELPPLKPAKRYLQISIHATRNTRRKMEDRHVSLPEFNQLFGLEDGVDRAYFAVYDGHGGIEAANYAATHLHVNLAHHKKLLDSPAEALRDSFQKTDEMFLSRARREKLRSGTTGVSCFLVDEKLHIAWLGDSQVMLVQQGKVITLMEPHKPEREDERQRIEDLGGCITYMDCWRVNGTLAVSRAIGDLLQKPYVSGCADGASFELTGTEDYVLLACDGFFDAIQPVEVVDHVLEHLTRNHGDGLQTAEKLVAAAKESGSTDNITVLVLFLREPKDIVADCLRDPKPCPVEDGKQGSPFSFFSSGTNH
ncbi:protein phosphatase 1F [Protobothrops mucrosquamatus]|uniref:protein phosphatase 1F n=1 Tax=Protobothrops mucrosquamatus TaxID=103944 RepID=UPI0010FB6BC6|nr:protein phosphatase 1F [Protobothrops mucrosquamatus]